MSFATYLENCVSPVRYLFDSRLLCYSNLHQLYDFEPVRTKLNCFLEAVKEIQLPGFENAVETLNNNIKGVLVQVDEQFVLDVLDKHFDADFLSYKRIDHQLFCTWQEALFCVFFNTLFRNGKLEPSIRLRGGGEIPDVSSWVPNLLALAKEAFSDARAICVIETIKYCCQGQAPSQESQALLAKLALDRIAVCLTNEDPLPHADCASLQVIEDLHNNHVLEKGIKSHYYEKLSELLSPIDDYESICFMKDHRMPLSKSQQELFSLKSASFAKDSLEKVGSAYDLIRVFQNSKIARNCDTEDIDRSRSLFSDFLNHIGVETANLFYWAMTFYIDALNNPCIDNKIIREIIISLMHSWQDQFYEKVLKSMKPMTYSASISSQELANFNKEFLESPQSLAHSLVLQSDEGIAKIIEEMSEHAIVYMVGRLTISEYYPEYVHVVYKEDSKSIDYMIVSELKRVYERYSYRFINSLDEQKLIDGFYDRIGQGIKFVLQMIDLKPVYSWIGNNLPRGYKLLPFPAEQPVLGDLTQLFPILETVIRRIGELFSIVPFQASKEGFERLKDVSSVLSELISSVRELTGTIQGCNEFLFVHYVMYSQNGFNVRNDCIHGRQYQSLSGIGFAFRATTICLYMMLKRLRSLESFLDARRDAHDGD